MLNFSENEIFKNIHLVIFDFDGVFTDNAVYINQRGEETVRCSRSDGLGLRLLDKVNVQYCIVSSESNPVVKARAKKLNIEVNQGHIDKLPVVEKIAKEKNNKMDTVAYVGNDINDIECLKIVGLPIAVADSFSEVLNLAKYITTAKGGYGAVREVCELLYLHNK